MQTLLNDIELDIQDLKCLMQALANDANPALRTVAERNIQQMRIRLDALQALLSVEVVEPIEPILPAQPIQSISPLSTSILAERIKPATDLRRGISLNDSFRFARELFHGDAARMNEVVNQLSQALDLESAMHLFTVEVHVDEENEASADFIELLKKHFN